MAESRRTGRPRANTARGNLPIPVTGDAYHRPMADADYLDDVRYVDRATARRFLVE
jgi:hypothetical protein